MSLLVKICGITTLEDARYCAGAGADFLGFIQHPESPRYVAPEEAAAIIGWIYGPQSVGVFVDKAPETVNRVAETAGFALVQLHGDETPEECARIERPVIKSFRVGPETTADALRVQIESYRAHVSYVLLDTRVAGRVGGTGTVFDWEIARSLASDYSLFLAGGLTPGNVTEAVRRVRPTGVDVASGLEAAPGRKEFDKVQTFFDAVHALRAATS